MHIRASRNNLGYIRTSDDTTPWVRIGLISALLLISFLCLYLFVFNSKTPQPVAYSASSKIRAAKVERYGSNPLYAESSNTSTGTTHASTTADGLALSEQLTTSTTAGKTSAASARTESSAKPLADYEAPVFAAIQQGGKSQEHIKEDARAYVAHMTSQNKEASRGFIRGDQPIRITRSGIDISVVTPKAASDNVAGAKQAAVAGEKPWVGNDDESPTFTVTADGGAAANRGYARNTSSNTATGNATVNDANTTADVSATDLDTDTLTLSSLLAKAPGYAGDTDGLFYVHTVRQKDSQGVWGVIHYSLVDRFAEGIAINEGGKTATYKINIPLKADEILPNRRSSFLGRFIDDKVRRSVVYDIEQGSLVEDRDRIQPKTQVVVVRFSPEELVLIYQYFANLGETQKQTS